MIDEFSMSMTRSYFSNGERMPMPSNDWDWDTLRQQARQLENEIDAKLLSFTKLTSNYLARDQSTTYISLDSSSFDTMSIEIEKLLEHLNDTNRRMSDTISSLHGLNSGANHTLQRHYEISQDYRRDFQRIRAKLQNFQTREEFLMNHSASNDRFSSGLNSRRHDQTVINETQRLIDTDASIDRLVNAASTVKHVLNNQGRHLRHISGKLIYLTERFPLLANIMHRIRSRKQKDALIIAFFIAFCLILLLIVIFH